MGFCGYTDTVTTKKSQKFLIFWMNENGNFPVKTHLELGLASVFIPWYISVEDMVIYFVPRRLKLKKMTSFCSFFKISKNVYFQNEGQRNFLVICYADSDWSNYLRSDIQEVDHLDCFHRLYGKR